MSAANKERLAPPALYPVVERKDSPEIPPEVSDYVEKVEKGQHTLTQPVQDDQTGQVLVTSPQAQTPKIVLPLSLEEYEQGLKTKVESSLRWLSEWSQRLIKMFGYKVGFRQK